MSRSTKISLLFITVLVGLLHPGWRPCQATLDLSLENDELYSLVDVIGAMTGSKMILYSTRPLTHQEFGLFYGDLNKTTSLYPNIQDGFMPYVIPFSNEILSTLGFYHKGYTTHSTYMKPLSSFRIRSFYLLPEDHKIALENSDGDIVRGGGDAKLDIKLEGNLWNRIFLFLEPELSLSPDKNKGRIKRGYVKWLLWGFDLEAGRDSLWFGPGHNGALLLSNNAPPFNLFKLTNSTPAHMPLIGGLKFTFFLTRLGRNRYVPRPWFSGWRVGLKPYRLVEFGISHTIIYGGEGRPDIDLWDHLRLILLFKEWNVSPDDEKKKRLYNNRLAAVDVTVYMPFLDYLPMLKGGKVYYERGGEDMPRFPKNILPTAVGHLFGLLLTTGRTDLRAEFAYNHDDVATWYGEPDDIYRFYYKDTVMGHHMGPDGQDLYVGIRRRFGRVLKVEFHYNRTWQGVTEDPEIRDSFQLSPSLRLGRRFGLSFSGRYDSHDNKAIYFIEADTSFFW